MQKKAQFCFILFEIQCMSYKIYETYLGTLKNLNTYSRNFTTFNVQIENERLSFTTSCMNSSSIPNGKYICVTL